MGKGKMFSCGCTTNGSMCALVQQWADVNLPKFGGRSVLTLEDYGIVVADGDSGCCECNIAASITELADVIAAVWQVGECCGHGRLLWGVLGGQGQLCGWSAAQCQKVCGWQWGQS